MKEKREREQYERNKILKTVIAMLSLCILFACATSKGGKVNPETGEGAEQALFAEYKENRPDAAAVQIGNANADKIFASIAETYGLTIEFFDKYTARVENSKPVSIGEEIRREKGDEAYKEYVASLEGEDKKQYDEFLKNEVNNLDVIVSYLTKATTLASAVSALNPKDLTSNPMKIRSVAKGINVAKNQIDYSCRTLGWLKKTQDSYKAAQTYQGK